MQVRPFNVLAKLPAELEPLREIAYNLWFAWNWEAVHLFIRMDPVYWEKTYQNPTLMLGMTPQERFVEIAKDDSFVANMQRVYEKFKAYVGAKTWYQRTHGAHPDCTIAYFSTEFGIDVGLPIYSGGLGVLAGDHLKSASDLGLPLVAVGLLYREGFMMQRLTADGWQQEAYPENDWYNMPVCLVKDDAGNPIRAQIELAGETVVFQIWRVQVGRTPLHLLDTDLPENSPASRAITERLYDGNRDTRLRQEILLGVGGMRALTAMGIEPSVCHMNEGHSAFMAIERTRQVMERYGLSRQEAWEMVWASTVFTTHTPVPAGNERFATDLVKHYLHDYVTQMGFGWDEFLALGSEDPKSQGQEFCLTTLALRHAAHANGVSELHGRTSRRLWQQLWPNVPVDEVPISSITNGIHTHSWLSHDMADLLERYLGPRFVEEPMSLSLWDRVDDIPDVEIWRTHEVRRERLIWFARKRLRQQLTRQGASPHVVAEAEQLLDPDALTIGFARRFAAYKRGALILSDPKRLSALLNNAERPVQIIFAGKAHPSDTQGKELIRTIFHFIRRAEFRANIVFLEDYDINVARYLVQGADVWLNNPKRPLEASGTSGMKAAANGALNLSTLDGWWCEGYAPDVGWLIGSDGTYASDKERDALESGAIYEILEEQIIPMFYDRGRDGMPRQWIKRMKQSMKKLGSQFNSNRMAADYLENFYLPANDKYHDLATSEQGRAKALAAWRSHLRAQWSNVRIESVESNADQALAVGDELDVVARVRLGEVKPEQVEIQLYHGMLTSGDRIAGGMTAVMSPEGAKDGVTTYRCAAKCRHSGRRGFAVRVLPYHTDLVHPFEPDMIHWG